MLIPGCGLTCLETAANPYVTVLGHPRDAERRINLAQSFNGLGWLVGPLVGAWFLFGGDGGEAKGDALHREAYQLLKKADESGTIHFIGNIEAREVPDGGADVVVAGGKEA